MFLMFWPWPKWALLRQSRDASKRWEKNHDRPCAALAIISFYAKTPTKTKITTFSFSAKRVFYWRLCRNAFSILKTLDSAIVVSWETRWKISWIVVWLCRSVKVESIKTMHFSGELLRRWISIIRLIPTPSITWSKKGPCPLMPS